MLKYLKLFKVQALISGLKPTRIELEEFFLYYKFSFKAKAIRFDFSKYGFQNIGKNPREIMFSFFFRI